MLSSRALIVASLFSALIAVGCKPDYPRCETDKDCSDKKEFCVAGKCEQCRDTKDCPVGTSCNSGRCDKIANYCNSAAECPAGTPCVANRCTACASDKD